LQKLGDIAETGRFIASCAACIAVISADTKYYLEDGCAATENILVAAQAHDLGSCWVAGDKKPYAQDVISFLKAPATFKLVSLIALGYPVAKNPQVAKRSLKELIHWEMF
jgi:nitroreductase